MTQQSRTHFLATILPYIRQLAVRRAAGIVDRHDREDAEADFIAKAWEIYTVLYAIKFLFEITLKRRLQCLKTIRPKKTRKLPVVLSPSSPLGRIMWRFSGGGRADSAAYS